MSVPSVHRSMRQLLAFLTVVAAFMFQVRQDALGGLIPHAMPPQAAQTSQAAQAAPGPAHHMTAQHMTAQHMTAPMAGEPSPASPVPESHQPLPHQHAAHCPFCLSNAFALEAGVVGLPQGPPTSRPAPERQTPVLLARVPCHADARAPPPLL